MIYKEVVIPANVLMSFLKEKGIISDGAYMNAVDPDCYCYTDLEDRDCFCPPREITITDYVDVTDPFTIKTLKEKLTLEDLL